MGFVDRFRSLLDAPTVEVPVWECTACETPAAPRDDRCPKCGGELRQTTTERVPLYWELD